LVTRGYKTREIQRKIGLDKTGTLFPAARLLGGEEGHPERVIKKDCYPQEKPPVKVSIKSNEWGGEKSSTPNGGMTPKSSRTSKIKATLVGGKGTGKRKKNLL